MKELSTFTPGDLDEGERSRLMLLVCDEESISCATIRKLQNFVTNTGLRAVLAIPDYQYQKGLRGWAKVQILASIVNQLEGVMPIDYETAKRELGNNWALVRISGQVKWSKSAIILQEIEAANLKIIETTDPFDVAMIDRAKKVAEASNCWQDPAGCVFVRDEKVLAESASTSFNRSNCRGIPINFKDLELNPDERMFFCDSLHSERVAISEAAKREISLNRSTMYVTKFPCRSCALSVIAAGVKEIVFEKDSYGFIEVGDLFQTNPVILKRVIR